MTESLNGRRPDEELSDEEIRFLHKAFDLAEHHEGKWVPLIIDEEGVRLGEPSSEGEAQRLPVDGGIPIAVPPLTPTVSSELGEAARRP